MDVNVDRILADEAGLTQKDVASSLLISLSASGQVAPNEWLDPKNGVNYQVAAQTPQYKIDTFDAMQRTPITAASGGTTQLLYNLARLKRNNSPEVESHYDIQPVVDIFASPDRRDLGGLAADIEGIIAKMRPTLPRGTTIDLRGQVDTMRTSFTRLGLGMIFAVVLVYLVMAVNFQSWLDPFIILTALPGAMAGMLWMLYLTRTTLSVPALMGAIMGIGVATANSILLVTFANDERATGKKCSGVCSCRGFHAHPAGYHDGTGDDHRHASDGIRPGRRRRAERPAGKGGDRRAPVCDAYYAIFRPDYLYVASKESAGGHGSPDR